MAGKSRSQTWPTKIRMNTDGASRGNPGLSSYGIYVTDSDGNVVDEISEPLGLQTNNYAEYTAVVRALELAAENKVAHVIVRSDSELLIRQLNGQYKVKSESLRPLYSRCIELAKKIGTVEFVHVRRELNQEADRLANLALDSSLI